MPNMLQLNCTKDKNIRIAFKKFLQNNHKGESNTIILDELGLIKGSTRIDIAVINGIMHGYELKSDLDTLLRLPDQMKIYNSIFDKVTLVVGKNHVFEAIKIVPDWWGIIMAKINETDRTMIFYNIRECSQNTSKNSYEIVKLLWKKEAIEILKRLNKAVGVSSKPINVIYDQIVTLLDQNTLSSNVREYLFNRLAWRSLKPHTLYDG